MTPYIEIETKSDNSQKRYKHKKNEWISKGIIKSIEMKDKVYKLMTQHTIDDVT